MLKIRLFALLCKYKSQSLIDGEWMEKLISQTAAFMLLYENNYVRADEFKKQAESYLSEGLRRENINIASPNFPPGFEKDFTRMVVSIYKVSNGFKFSFTFYL